MTKDQLTKILAYVDVAIAAVMARDSSDGGLIEIIRLNEIRDELFATLEEGL